MSIFQRIATANAEVSGWCSLEKANTLAAIVLSIRPEISLEIGVWHGRSLIPMALAHRHINHGIVIAVDPWKASASVAGQVNKADQEWWNRQVIHEDAYKSFVSHLVNNDVASIVEVRRMPSDDFEPPFGIGLLSVDGNHGEQSVRDIQRYAPMVDPGGFIVADDINWSGGSVSRAIGLLPAMGFHELYRVENDKESWAVFQKA